MAGAPFPNDIGHAPITSDRPDITEDDSVARRRSPNAHDVAVIVSGARPGGWTSVLRRLRAADGGGWKRTTTPSRSCKSARHRGSSRSVPPAALLTKLTRLQAVAGLDRLSKTISAAPPERDASASSCHPASRKRTEPLGKTGALRESMGELCPNH